MRSPSSTSSADPDGPTLFNHIHVEGIDSIQRKNARLVPTVPHREGAERPLLYPFASSLVHNRPASSFQQFYAFFRYDFGRFGSFGGIVWCEAIPRARAGTASAETLKETIDTPISEPRELNITADHFLGATLHPASGYFDCWAASALSRRGVGQAGFVRLSPVIAAPAESSPYGAETPKENACASQTNNKSHHSTVAQRIATQRRRRTQTQQAVAAPSAQKDFEQRALDFGQWTPETSQRFISCNTRHRKTPPQAPWPGKWCSRPGRRDRRWDRPPCPRRLFPGRIWQARRHRCRHCH